MKCSTSVTVILPVLNQAKFLPISLPALLEQTGVDRKIDILVVDNGSTDGSLEIASIYPRVRILHEAKRGSYAARNCAIRASSSSLLVFLDPDCVPSRGWLQAAIDALDDPCIEVAMGPRTFGHSSTLRRLSDFENLKIQWVLSNGLASKAFGYTCNMVVRRTLFDRIGLFRELNRGADTLLIQTAIGVFGIHSVRYIERMSVHHLEINSIADFLARKAVYGNSSRSLSETVSFRPLSAFDTIQIFFAAVTRYSFSVSDALALLAVLGPLAFLYGLRYSLRSMRG